MYYPPIPGLRLGWFDEHGKLIAQPGWKAEQEYRRLKWEEINDPVMFAEACAEQDRRIEEISAKVSGT